MPGLRKPLNSLQHRIAPHGRIIAVAVLSTIFLIGTLSLAPWFFQWTTSWLESGSPNKTRWDYVKDILLPLLSGGLVIFAVWYLEAKSAQRRDQIRSEREQIRIETENAAVLQRNEMKRIETLQRNEIEKAEALQRYLDRISTVLMDYQVISLSRSARRLGHNYRDPLVESARDLIRSRTLSILRYFSEDLDKKTTVIRLLIETRILEELGVSLSGADLTGVSLIGTNLRGISFNGADLRKAILRGISYSNANLIGSDLSGADLSSADLSEGNLLGTNLRGANLRGIKFTMANLTQSDLRSADLKGADVRGADLSSANLSDANLFGADLLVADLSGADLSLANLREAKLLGADMKGVRWNHETVWPDPNSFKGARNMPEDLKRIVGL